MQPGMDTSKAHYYTSGLLDQGPKRKQVSAILSGPVQILNECCNFPALVVFVGPVLAPHGLPIH